MGLSSTVPRGEPSGSHTAHTPSTGSVSQAACHPAIFSLAASSVVVRAVPFPRKRCTASRE